MTKSISYGKTKANSKYKIISVFFSCLCLPLSHAKIPFVQRNNCFILTLCSFCNFLCQSRTFSDSENEDVICLREREPVWNNEICLK